MIKIKRIYEPTGKDDGYRILVDRLWPRGISKNESGVDLWLRDIAPSDTLRRWFQHDPKKWTAFQREYRRELALKREFVQQVRQLEKENGRVTLLYSAKDNEHNNARALQLVLQGIRNR